MKKLTLSLLLVLLLAACGGNDPTPTNTAIPPTDTTLADTPTPSIDLTEVAADCEVTVDSALELVSEVCAGTERNQVCYGNQQLVVEPQSPDFEKPGDIVSLDDVQSIRLDPMNTVNDSWGVALMRVQANLPDTLPGQNVTFLLFGDVSMQSEGSQVFYFQSGIGDVSCSQEPADGVLVQTPDVDLDVSFTMNGVDINLAGTAYVQAQADESMTVDVIDGEAEVTVEDNTTVVLAGFQTSVSLDADGLADDAPEEAVPSEEIESLPLDTLEDVREDVESFPTAVPSVVGDTNPITLGDEVAGTIDVAGEIDTYTLTLESRQQIVFGGKGSDIPVQWDVNTELGGLLIDNEGMWFGNELGSFDLEAGTYTITVKSEHDELGEYTFRTWAVPEPQTFDYQIGDALTEGSVGEGSGLFDVPGDTDMYTFTLDSPQQVIFVSKTSGISASWDVTTVGGEIIFADEGMWFGNELGPFDLAAGTYIITTKGVLDTTGPYEFLTWAVSDSQAYDYQIGDKVAGEEDGEGFGVIDVAGDTDVYTFTLASPQQVVFAGETSGISVNWTVASDDGEIVFADEGMWFGHLLGPFDLAAGTYSITVWGEVDATGAYEFSTWEQPEPQTFDYQIGALVTDSSVGDGSGVLETPGASDIYTFTLESETDLFFAALGSDTNAEWRLETEDAQVIFDNNGLWLGNHQGVLTLDAGTYHIIVTAEFGGIGTYELRVWEQIEPQQFNITLPITVSQETPEEGMGNLNAPGASDVYTFTLNETQTYYFDSGDADSNLIWHMEDAQGHVYFTENGLWPSNDPGAFELEAGDYNITVTAEHDATGDYAFEIRVGDE